MEQLLIMSLLARVFPCAASFFSASYPAASLLCTATISCCHEGFSLALPWDTTEVVSTWVKRWICFSHPGWVERDVPQGAWDLVLSLENIPSIYESISRAKLIFLLHFTKAQAEPSPGKPNRARILQAQARKHLRYDCVNTDVYVFTFASF